MQNRWKANVASFLNPRQNVMSFTATGHSTSNIQTEGQRLDPIWSAARRHQTEALARLEEKYGGRKLRMDSAHLASNPHHLQAFQLQVYTDWLTRHCASRQPPAEPVWAVQTATDATPNQTPQRSLADPISNLAYASPDILAAPFPPTADSAATRPRPAFRRSSLPTPVDNSRLLQDRSRRTDLAHEVTGTTRSRRSRSAPRTKPGYNLPTSSVAWEVEDFTWPDVMDSSNLMTTQTAQIMVDAIASSLSTTQQRLAVVGSGRGKGTTTISMFVAKILAARNNKVLLVDADLAKPDLTSRLGLPANLSWINLIDQNHKYGESIVRSIETGVCVMPVSRLTARVAWPKWIYDCLAGILDEVRQQFDVVILDVGPASQLIRELSRPNKLVDTAILVHNVRVPENAAFVRNQNELNSFGIKKLVVAENFAA